MTRISWLLIAACSVATLHGSAAIAADQVFYSSPQWQVALVDTYASTGEAPYCAIRTTSWSSKQVSIEMPLQGVDKIGIAVRVQKDGWKLPVGDKTDFGFVVGAIGSRFTAEAISESTLYSVFDPKAPSEGWFLFGSVVGSIFSDRKPFALQVVFEGDEKPWSVSNIDPFQAHQVSTASRECQAALNQLGPTIFGSTSEAEDTSPFGDKQDDEAGSAGIAEDMAAGKDQMTGEPNHSSDGTAVDRWVFTHHEEDWGNVCVVEVKKDDFQIGFMATPGLEKIAYIEGLDVQSANAFWQVDANKAYPLRGEHSDYFGFLAFDVPSPNFIEELMQGTTLNISVIGKAKYAIDVSSARKAFTQFVDCHSKGGATAKAGAAASAAACLDVRDQAQLVFSGRLTQSVFPGPPNYESIDAGDKAETAFLLGLTQPICASGDEFLSPDERISTVHVYSEDAQTAAELKRLTDQEVRVTGVEAFGSNTGHHRARLVVHVRSVEPDSAANE